MREHDGHAGGSRLRAVLLRNPGAAAAGQHHGCGNGKAYSGCHGGKRTSRKKAGREKRSPRETSRKRYSGLPETTAAFPQKPIATCTASGKPDRPAGTPPLDFFPRMRYNTCIRGDGGIGRHASLRCWYREVWKFKSSSPQRPSGTTVFFYALLLPFREKSAKKIPRAPLFPCVSREFGISFALTF